MSGNRTYICICKLVLTENNENVHTDNSAFLRYAWVILATVFTINTICAGYIKSFGILYMLILDQYPEASGPMGGLMMGLLNGCRGLLCQY